MGFKTEKIGEGSEYLTWEMGEKDENYDWEVGQDPTQIRWQRWIMELGSVLDAYNYTRPEYMSTEHMRTGDESPGLEHCVGLMWEILGGRGEDDSEMGEFLRQQMLVTRLNSCDWGK